MKEVWKDVVGYEGLYKVSNLGNVKSLNYNKTKKEKMLRQSKDCNGYFTVNLVKNKKAKHNSIHRMVAQAFIDNHNNYEMVNHKDEDKTNNRIDNLEWCDRKYNTNYGSGIKRSAAKHNKKVYQYDLKKNLIKEWNSLKECTEHGFTKANISACCLNKPRYKTHKGYIWSYKKI